MTVKTNNANDLTDVSPANREFLVDAIRGLNKQQKTMSAKYLYDKRGSELFDQICELDDYYPTRTELSIMRRYGDEMAKAIGPQSLLIEYGSGSSMKTATLLKRLPEIAGYVPLDISKKHLEEAANRTAKAFPELSVYPVCADFTQSFKLPEINEDIHRKVAYFPGSTIGNFTREQAVKVLQHISKLLGVGGGLLIGVDLEKDPRVLERAYDDSEGVTAEFNLNLLRRMNRELNADFDLDAFEHQAVYNDEKKRIEMHLVAESPQSVTIGNETVEFDKGESIHTENSHKFSVERFARLAAEANFRLVKAWTDDRRYFSVIYLEVVK